jgi:hypothetical protein
VDKIGLDCYQLRGQASEHLLSGKGVHLPHAYFGLGLRFANQIYLVGEGAMSGKGRIQRDDPREARGQKAEAD